MNHSGGSAEARMTRPLAQCAGVAAHVAAGLARGFVSPKPRRRHAVDRGSCPPWRDVTDWDRLRHRACLQVSDNPASHSGQLGGTRMSETKIGRREFLTSVSVAGVASATALAPDSSAAQAPSQAPAPAHAAEAAGYAYLKPAEQAFVEALVDHMI